MKLKQTFFLILLVFIISKVEAQTNNVQITRSTEKVLIGGKIYFIHTVKKGETLYSIAKAYNLSVEDVIANNPNQTADLQTGQSLRIPESKATESKVIPISEGQVLHVVSAGQTIYAISRIYGVTVSDIEAENPELKYDSLQLNQVIKIPPSEKKKNISTTKENAIVHKVAEKETLYSLSKRYGVNTDEIVKFNDPLLKDGLKVGQEIFIPVAKNETIVTAPVALKNGPTIVSKADINCPTETPKIKYDSVNIALLLPLFTSGNKEQSSEEESNEENIQQRQTETFDPVSVNFIEFYQGFMLAASELKRKGLKIKVSVYDTEKSSKNIDLIFNKPSIKNSNLIVGPIYPDQIMSTFEKANQNNAIIISPVAQHNDLTSNNPRLYQINPGIDAEYQKCIDLLLADSTKNIVVIYKSETGSSENQYEQFNKLLQSKLQTKNIKIKSLNVFNNDFSGLETELDSLKDNVVFTPVNDEIFITSMCGQLDAKLLFYRIKAIGMQDWMNYRGIDLNYFHDLQMSYFTAFYSDFQKESSKVFLKRYRLTYGTEPIRASKYGFNYGFLGYNTAYYFITGYMYYGFEIAQHSECLKKLQVPYLFYFDQINENGGFINSSLKMVTFEKDYSLMEGN